MALIMSLAYLLRNAKKFYKKGEKFVMAEQEHIRWAKELFSQKDDVNERI